MPAVIPLILVRTMSCVDRFINETGVKKPVRNGFHSPKNKKNIHFPFSLAKFFCRSAAVSILMPPTFHIASLNRYTSKFSGVPEKHVIHLLKAYASSAVNLDNLETILVHRTRRQTFAGKFHMVLCNI